MSRALISPLGASLVLPATGCSSGKDHVLALISSRLINAKYFAYRGLICIKHHLWGKPNTAAPGLAGCWMLGSGYWVLDTRCWVLDAG